MEVCRLEVLLQYMKRDMNELILYYIIYCFCRINLETQPYMLVRGKDMLHVSAYC